MKSEKLKLKFKMSGSQTANSTLFSENGIFSRRLPWICNIIGIQI